MKSNEYKIKEFDNVIAQIDPLPDWTIGRNENTRLKSFILKYFKNLPIKFFTIKRFQNISKRITTQIPNLNTQNSFFIDTRRVLKDRKVNPTSLLYYSAGQEAYLKRKENANQSLLSKKPLSIKISDYVSMIKELNKSVNVYDHILLVCMCIGSRPIEILSVSTFTCTENPHYILITGFAKAREKTINQIIRPIVELTCERILELISSIQQNHIRINKSGMNKVFISRGFDAQTARDAYAHVSYELYANKNQITLFSWITQVLNHSDTTTSANYGRTNIIHEESKSNSR